MKAKTISVIILILFLILSFSYAQNKTAWKGKIEYENGIEVIKNPKKPIYKKEVFSLSYPSSGFPLMRPKGR